MADEIDEDAGFPNEDINRCVQEAAESVLENAMWDEKKVPLWINEICEKTMKSLGDLKCPYKYIVTCMLI